MDLRVSIRKYNDVACLQNQKRASISQNYSSEKGIRESMEVYVLEEYEQLYQ